MKECFSLFHKLTWYTNSSEKRIWCLKKKFVGRLKRIKGKYHMLK